MNFVKSAPWDRQLLAFVFQDYKLGNYKKYGKSELLLPFLQRFASQCFLLCFGSILSQSSFSFCQCKIENCNKSFSYNQLKKNSFSIRNIYLFKTKITSVASLLIFLTILNLFENASEFVNRLICICCLGKCMSEFKN